MEPWKIGENIDENMCLNTTRKCSASGINEETVEGTCNLRKPKKAQILVRVCEVVVFLVLISAFMYSCKSLWDLKSELGTLKQELKAEVFLRKWCTDILIKEERALSSLNQLLGPDGEESFISEVNGILKRKREIRLSDENASEHSTSIIEKESTPSVYSDSEEYSSEYFSGPLVKPSNWTTRKPRRSHKRSKKHYRYVIPPEKFFTDVESTTSTPIQVRQSRTKLTDDSQEYKLRNDMSRKPLLQTYGSKESITRAEALLRPVRPSHLMPGNELENRVQNENDSKQHSSEPRKISDAITYNMIMVHYAADTTHYAKDANPHYFGNGRIQMKTSIYKDWKPVHWTQGVDISRYFSLNEGKIAVSVTGIYLIYAQVQYSNKQEVNGYAVIYNKKPIVQCITTSIHPDKEEVKSNTCGTSTTILLHSNDRIYLQDLHHGRHVVLTPEKSYFGLILLSPFQENI